MSSYSLFMPPEGNGDEARLVRDGGALSFWLAPAYLIRHRLWFAAAIYALTAFAIVLFAAAVSAASAVALLLLVHLFVWLEGGQMRRRALERRGWSETAVVTAADRDEAELRVSRVFAEARGDSSPPTAAAEPQAS